MIQIYPMNSQREVSFIMMTTKVSKSNWIIAAIIFTLSAELKANNPADPLITALDEPNAEKAVFDDATRTKPIVLKSADDAAKYFSKAELAKLTKAVDFKKRVVLIFAWRGSGQDLMDLSVGESDPERVIFKVKPGRTRDLRPHTVIYSLRSNVMWSAK